MNPIARALLPDNASVAPNGHLLIAGCDLVELAAEFGTPLFVYDEDHIRKRCREAVAAFGPMVSYATKAFSCLAMARLVHEEGLYLDVSTGGEYHVARSAGVPAQQLVLHGNNKSVEELTTAMSEGIGRIVVDSFDELDRIEALVAEGLAPPKVLLRVTPGVEAHTHEFVQTGQDDSKFGFTVSTGAADQAIDRATRSSAVELVGLHAHIGSQVFEARFFAMAIEAMADLLSAHADLPELSIGGGLGVAYVEGEPTPTITEWAEAIHSACDSKGLDITVSVEPGRAIVAAAGVTLYTVGTVKNIPGIREYVAVDGGMSDNPRPVLYGSGYEAFLPRAVESSRPRIVTVVGKHCESGDKLIVDASVPEDLEVGDILCTPVTGAYGYSMASNYNKVPRPPVVFVRDGAARVVVRGERYEDLTRLDL